MTKTIIGHSIFILLLFYIIYLRIFFSKRHFKFWINESLKRGIPWQYILIFMYLWMQNKSFLIYRSFLQNHWAKFMQMKVNACIPRNTKSRIAKLYHLFPKNNWAQYQPIITWYNSKWGKLMKMKNWIVYK